MKPSAYFDRPAFAEVARIISPGETPACLPAFLALWSQGIRHDRLVEHYQPSTTQLKQRSKDLQQAISTIKKEIKHGTPFRSVLDNLPSNPVGRGQLPSCLRALESGVVLVQEGSVNTNGTAKPGRIRSQLSREIPAKTLCAARVIELMTFFRGVDTGPDAARVAQAFWEASGGDRSGAEDPSRNWRLHLKRARTSSDPRLMNWRSKWRRDILETSERGRPLWPFGNNPPANEGQFLSISELT